MSAMSPGWWPACGWPWTSAPRPRWRPGAARSSCPAPEPATTRPAGPTSGAPRPATSTRPALAASAPANARWSTPPSGYTASTACGWPTRQSCRHSCPHRSTQPCWLSPSGPRALSPGRAVRPRFRLPRGGGWCMLYQCGRDNTSLLADRRLRRLAIALIASGAADASLPVALSFAVLRVTGSAGRLGLVLAAQSGVALLLTLAGGVAGDRFPRSRILAASLSVRAVMAAALAGALLTRTASFGLLLGLAGGYGCADGFFGPASTAVLPEVVPAGRLARANALIGGSTSVARIAAPAIAGTIVAAFGPGAGFAVQAAVLAVAVAALLAAHLASARPTASGSAADDPAADGPAIRGPGEQAPGVLGQLRSGWAEFARLRWLWLLTCQWAVYSMVILAPVSVLGPLIAERSLGGAAAWGIISSCLSLGAVAGQLAASRVRFPARPAFAIAWLMPLMTAEALA